MVHTLQEGKYTKKITSKMPLLGCRLKCNMCCNLLEIRRSNFMSKSGPLNIMSGPSGRRWVLRIFNIRKFTLQHAATHRQLSKAHHIEQKHETSSMNGKIPCHLISFVKAALKAVFFPSGCWTSARAIFLESSTQINPSGCRQNDFVSSMSRHSREGLSHKKKAHTLLAVQISDP